MSNFIRSLMPLHHRGILSQERKTEWKCTYGELVSKTKCLQQNEQKLSGLTQKRSNTSQDISNDCETLRKERQRVRFKESQSRDKAETPTCPTCRQIIANEAKDYSCFMEKSVGLELITVVVIIDVNVVGKRCFVERGELWLHDSCNKLRGYWKGQAFFFIYQVLFEGKVRNGATGGDTVEKSRFLSEIISSKEWFSSFG